MVSNLFQNTPEQITLFLPVMFQIESAINLIRGSLPLMHSDGIGYPFEAGKPF